MRFRLATVLTGVAAALGLLLLGAAPASAHGGATPDVVSVAQTLGLHELTVTMYPPTDGTGPMPIRIVAHGRAPECPLLVKAVSAAGSGESHTVMAPGAGPGAPATGTLQIDRPGAWEIVLVASPDVARIPLSVPAAPPTPGWVWVVRVGVVVAAVGALAASAVWRRRPRTALGLGAGAVVGAAMATTAALLSTSVAAPGPAAAGSASHDMAGTEMSDAHMAGMSGSGAVLLTANLLQATDGLVELVLGLTDGSTGARVDDLVIHDDALVHLAVIGPGGKLWHVHPVRTAPGRFSIRLPVSAPGRYGIFAELERAGGGHQITRSAFTLAAGRPSAPTGSEVAAPQFPGSREVAGMRVDVTVGTPAAGRGSRVELVFSQNGEPVRDLQAWLGMGGHLLVLGPSAGPTDPDPTDPATSFAHLHSVDGYGPNIGFTYAFPAGGRYQLWAQVQRDWQLVTIPITVDVAPMPTRTP